MTWIVGAPAMFGYGFGISDVRVTLGDGSEIDCLQKMYPVGRHFAAGFAGSVEIGFAMLQELRRLTTFEDPRMACDPFSVCREWPACAQTVFSRFSPETQESQCHLMLILVHPQEHVGNPAWPRSYVYISRSPSFDVEPVPVHSLGSIGCGNFYARCAEAIRSFGADRNREQLFMQGETGCQGGMVSMLGISLTDILKEVQPSGVSSHLHYCWVYRGRTIITTNNHTAKGRWTMAPLGSGINDRPEAESSSIPRDVAIAEGYNFFDMPKLAQSWEDLCCILCARGLSAQGSTA